MCPRFLQKTYRVIMAWPWGNSSAAVPSSIFYICMYTYTCIRVHCARPLLGQQLFGSAGGWPFIVRSPGHATNDMHCTLGEKSLRQRTIFSCVVTVDFFFPSSCRLVDRKSIGNEIKRGKKMWDNFGESWDIQVYKFRRIFVVFIFLVDFCFNILVVYCVRYRTVIWEWTAL